MDLIHPLLNHFRQAGLKLWPTQAVEAAVNGIAAVVLWIVSDEPLWRFGAVVLAVYAVFRATTAGRQWAVGKSR
jgi:hypothetical protein